MASPLRPSGSARRRDGDPRPDELDAWLQLQAALGLEPARAAALLRRTHSPRAALRAGGAAPPLAPAALARLRARLDALGVRALGFLDAAYPEPLLGLVDPPPLLLARGAAALDATPAVAIVGARAATAYGRRAAHRLAADLAAAGCAVVSGLARGIDAAAHEGALEARGCTLAVLAGGVDRVYPRAHGALAERMLERGALVSEFPLGSEPRRAWFPLRNRLISGLADVVVVVEARRRSGSLITARHAAEQGREVMAVPGPVDAPTSEGTNALLRDGARPALEAEDVLQEIGWWRGRAGRAAPLAAPAPLAPEAHALLAELRRAPATRDELAARSDASPAQLALALVELELAGRVAEDRDGRLHAVGRSA